VRGRGEGADDQLAPGGQLVEAVPAQVAQPALDAMTHDGAPDGAADHEPDPGRAVPGGRLVVEDEMHHEPFAPAAARPTRDTAQVVAPGEAMLRREHGREGTGPVEPRSDREALAALATTRGQDRPARAGAHAQPESVHLVAAAVVRLVRTLGHEFSPMVWDESRRRFGQIARWRRTELIETQIQGS
jgi:hypothetical protein